MGAKFLQSACTILRIFSASISKRKQSPIFTFQTYYTFVPSLCVCRHVSSRAILRSSG